MCVLPFFDHNVRSSGKLWRGGALQNDATQEMFYRHVTIRGHSAAATQVAEVAKNALSAQAAMTMQAGISNSHAKQFWSCSCCKMNASGNSHASKQNRAARADQAAARLKVTKQQKRLSGIQKSLAKLQSNS